MAYSMKVTNRGRKFTKLNKGKSSLLNYLTDRRLCLISDLALN